MPPVTELIAVMLLIGVVSSGLTEVVKILCRKWVGADVNSKDPVWWQAAFRVIPLLLGMAGGTQFFSHPWGVMTGAAAGVLCVVLYKKAKSLITGLSGPKV